ncbi:hypothetical protein GCM10020220_070200 [Nonomuraea rubra]|uniref:thioesterase II family protein n=1 Tax=Nonomuraea rubra TaxID=46180 RepID=UPI0031F119AC
MGRALTLAGRAPEHLVVSARATPATPYPLTLPDGDEELIDAVDRVYQGIPAALRDSPELLRLFAPVLRADLELAVSYVFPARAPAVVPDHGARRHGRPTVSEAELSAWRRHTSGAFASARFPGGHFYLDAAERPVLDTLWRCLAPRHALTRSSS